MCFQESASDTDSSSGRDKKKEKNKEVIYKIWICESGMAAPAQNPLKE